MLLGSLWLGPVPRCRRSHFGPPASGRLLLGRMLAACDHAVPPVVVVPLASFFYYFGFMSLHMPLPTTFTAPAPPVVMIFATLKLYCMVGHVLRFQLGG